MIIPVIMAGGSGTRLWPLSRTAFPKQFIALTSTLTMLQETAARINGLSASAPMVICNEEHRFLVAEQMRQQNLHPSILLEPVGRNTAPAIALAAIKALETNKEAVLLVLAADHVIEDVNAFHQCVNTLLPAVQAGKFGTLGIVPTEAATGYGYIQAENQAESKASTTEEVRTVSQFVEKPNAVTAAKYVADGYLWNSGMFLIRADRYLEELKSFRADIYDACIKSMATTQQDLDFVRIDVDAFAACPDESIDYAVMEPLAAKGQVVVAPLDAGWSDVGSWSALWEIAEKDELGNVTAGQNDENFILQGTENCYVYGSANTEGSGRLIATLGVENLVIVDTPDALLVANKDKVQNIKKIVAKIKESGRTHHHQHRQVYRPWGVYDSIDNGKRYQVKRITVKPGAKLSVQMHHHRAEHWIVVSGTAKVTNGDKTFLVTENESTYIPIGQVHALENPGVLPLEMIEVQSGSYLGEDDIVRFEDKYGRA
ncbi:MAG: mannose-1-phosphate guanylyltransferase/mannose-6-phosphate isomerase [Oleispira sp.]|nr:mannose-1-phosphate guanylyltransferase/mannose-6-phosphate isomerase [Oleispira sp.]